MIRHAVSSELERLEELWIYTLIKAHPSVPQDFWLDRREHIRQRLQQAEQCLVYAESGVADGFALVLDKYQLEYLCVSPAIAGRGVGSKLMHRTKHGRPQLQTAVLEENLKGRYFLQQQGFEELERQPCAGTGQAEILMQYRDRIFV